MKRIIPDLEVSFPEFPVLLISTVCQQVNKFKKNQISVSGAATTNIIYSLVGVGGDQMTLNHIQKHLHENLCLERMACNWLCEAVSSDESSAIYFVNILKTRHWQADYPRPVHKVLLHDIRAGVWCAIHATRITGSINFSEHK